MCLIQSFMLCRIAEMRMISSSAVCIILIKQLLEKHHDSKIKLSPVLLCGHTILFIITPYIRILDFDWLLAGAFFVYMYFHI